MTLNEIFLVAAPINYVLDCHVPVASVITHFEASYERLVAAGHTDIAQALSVAIEEGATEEEIHTDLRGVLARIANIWIGSLPVVHLEEVVVYS